MFVVSPYLLLRSCSSEYADVISIQNIWFLALISCSEEIVVSDTWWGQLAIVNQRFAQGRKTHHNLEGRFKQSFFSCILLRLQVPSNTS